MGSRHAAKATAAAIKLERDDFIIASDDEEKDANLPDPLSEFDDAVASTGHEIPLPSIFNSPFKNAPLPPEAESFQSPSKAPRQPDEYPLPGTNSPVKPEPLLSVSTANAIKTSMSSPPISAVAMPSLTPSPGKKKGSHHHHHHHHNSALRVKAHQQSQSGGIKKLRCVCAFHHDDGFLVQCNKCRAWQHVDCFYPHASSRPVAHRCHVCVPRYINVDAAKRLQKKKLTDRHSFKLNGHGVLSKGPAARRVQTLSSDDDDTSEACDILTSVSSYLPSTTSSGVTVASVVRQVASATSITQLIPPSTPTVMIADTGRSSKRKQSLQMRSTPDPMLMHTEEEIKLALMDSVVSRASRYKTAERNRYTEDLYRILYRIHKPGSAIKHTLLNELSKRVCDTIITEDNTIGVASPATYSVYDTVLEYRGELMTKEEYLEKHDPTKEYNPYALFYAGVPNVTIVADASKYGNEARFVRRSCKPNCEVKHAFGENSRLHLIIWATQKIIPGREILIPFDYDYTQCSYEVCCPCIKKTCDVRRHGASIRMRLSREAWAKEDMAIAAKKAKHSSKSEKKEKQVKSEPVLPSLDCKVKLERLALDESGEPTGVVMNPTIERVRSESPQIARSSASSPGGVSRHRNDAAARASLTARLQERLSPNKGSPGGLTSKSGPVSPMRGPPAFPPSFARSSSAAKTTAPTVMRSFVDRIAANSGPPVAGRKRSRKQQLVAIRDPFSEERNASSEDEEQQGSFWKS